MPYRLQILGDCSSQLALNQVQRGPDVFDALTVYSNRRVNARYTVSYSTRQIHSAHVELDSAQVEQNNRPKSVICTAKGPEISARYIFKISTVPNSYRGPVDHLGMSYMVFGAQIEAI